MFRSAPDRPRHPEIRHALLARVTDTDHVAWAEALRALARLGDTRATGPLQAALADTEADDETGEVAALLDEAREALGLGTGSMVDKRCDVIADKPDTIQR